MNVSNKPLIDALRHLAMPAEKQIAYLRSLGVAPSADELALEFDDSLTGLSLQAEIQELVRRLDERLESMSGAKHTSLWDFEALLNRAEWREVRSLAQKALEALESEENS